jgi:hypothetical protein
MPGNWPVRFGGGESEKYQQWQLVGFLSYAEIELSILARQCLSDRFPSREALAAQVDAWQHERNQAGVTINWRFTTADARIKLKRLYPSIEE